MAVTIAMLRGVNLGPNRRMSMQELRAVCEGMGLRDVGTYIQSGNIVFRTGARAPKNLARALEEAIERRFGFYSTVILRTASELRGTIAGNPFAQHTGIEPNRLLVWFLVDDPGEAARQQALAVPCAPDEIHAAARELYVYYRTSMARPKISMTAVEKLLGVAGTGRNWNTVGKLLEMAERIEGTTARAAR